MSLTLLILLVVLLGLIYLWLKHHYAYWTRRNVPHEQPVLLLGNMSGIGRRYHWNEIHARIYKRFCGTAPFVGFYTFMGKAAFILDLELIKQILIKDFASFADRGLFHNVRDDPLTGNLLFLDGEPWRVLRHKLSPVFTTGKMRFMFPTMVAVGERLVPACSDFLTSSADGQLEAKDLCARYTTDVIGTCAFGIECNSLKDPQAEFRRIGGGIFERPRHTMIVQAFMFTNPELARKLRLKNFTNEASDFFMKAVRETVELRLKHNIKRNDFMDMLIDLMKNESKDLAGTKDLDLSQGLTLEQVAAQAMVFFLAGFETSSTMMSFCMYELALNPKIQDKLRAEVRAVLDKHGGALTYESIKEMGYLDQVLSETLRKYSVLPHIVRQTVTDYKVPNTEFVFERGLRIIIPVDSIHKDPALYPEPEKFDPARFSPEEIAKRHPFAYLPFGEGPRNCIGMRFGRMQAQIGIITLMRHFRFSPTARTQIPLRYSKKHFLVATESGIHLRVEKL